MILCQYSRDWLYEEAIDIYSRRGAESAEVTYVFCKGSIVLFEFLCVLCASARKQDVKSPALAGLSIKRKHAATVRLSRNQYISNYIILEPNNRFALFAYFAANVFSLCFGDLWAWCWHQNICVFRVGPCSGRRTKYNLVCA